MTTLQLLKKELNKFGIYSHTYKLTNVRQNSGFLKVQEKYEELVQEHGEENVPHISVARDVERGFAYLYHDNIDVAKLVYYLRSKNFRVSWRGNEAYAPAIYLSKQAWEDEVERQHNLKNDLLDNLERDEELNAYVKENLQGVFDSVYEEYADDIFQLVEGIRQFIRRAEDEFATKKKMDLANKYGVPEEYVSVIRDAHVGFCDWDVVEKIIALNDKFLQDLNDDGITLYVREYHVPDTNAQAFIDDIPEVYKKFINPNDVKESFIDTVYLTAPEEYHNNYIKVYSEK